MDAKTEVALRELLSYTYHDEQKHFFASGKPRNHIFRSIAKLDVWLTQQCILPKSARQPTSK